jgi:hypothetical protein
MRAWGILSGLGVAVLTFACENGGARSPAGSDKGDAGPASAATGASSGGADGGDRPFAGSTATATDLIQQALDKHADEMNRCIKEYRFRKHLAHERVEVAVGIDQEGHVLGVTLPKGKNDEELSKCVQTAIHDAPFPKSHAGVITVTRSFEEMVR